MPTLTPACFSFISAQTCAPTAQLSGNSQTFGESASLSSSLPFLTVPPAQLGVQKNKQGRREVRQESPWELQVQGQV